MKIGLIVAMDIEYNKMLDALGGKAGRLGNNEIILWKCGIGKVNAAVGTMRLVQEHHPDAIISTGLAGGIDVQMQVMDVLAAEQCVYHDVDCGVSLDCVIGQVQGLPARFDADKRLLDHTLNVRLASSERLVRGLICTGDQFITSHEALAKIKEAFPAGLAVDMESVAIAQACYIYKVPFVSFRVISDTPGADQHQQQYENFWEEMADKSFHTTQRFLSCL